MVTKTSGTAATKGATATKSAAVSATVDPGAAPVSGGAAHETQTVSVENGGEAAKTLGSSGGEGSAPANIAGATQFEPSGAPDQVVGDVDPSHPAVDDNPRAHTTVDQNRIDFNDPTLTGAEAVEKNLAAQAGNGSAKSED